MQHQQQVWSWCLLSYTKRTAKEFMELLLVEFNVPLHDVLAGAKETFKSLHIKNCNRREGDYKEVCKG